MAETNDATQSNVLFPLLYIQGKKIISAMCYSNDALSYELSYHAGLSAYVCECSGTRKAILTNGTKMSCTIHYWQCEV